MLTEGTFCDKQSTWMPSKDGGYMKVSDDIPDEAFAVLNINVSGFANSSLDGRVYGRLTLKFQMSCEKSDPCILYLMQVSESNELRLEFVSVKMLVN